VFIIIVKPVERLPP